MTDTLAVLLDSALPEEAWNQLAADPGAVLIDVRCREERMVAGCPDLDEIERDLWQITWPKDGDTAPISLFLAEVAKQVIKGEAERLFFLCNSGRRARTAAEAVAAIASDFGRALHLTHVLEGFDGATDRKGVRGGLNGWKRADLPWREARL